MVKKHIITDPDFKALLHQQMEEMESLVMEKTTIEIVQLNMRTHLNKLKKEEEDISELKKYPHGFKIILKEQDGAKIEGYGYGLDPFEALKNARGQIESIFDQIHEESISTAARNSEIYEVLRNKTIH